MNTEPTSSRIQRSLPWRRRWIEALMVLTLLCGVAGTVNLCLDIGRPFCGYVVVNAL